jgi:hypothetical protein
VFRAPLWLLGLAVLAIPLALHLWSRRPRDVIRVGSLRHVTDVAEARSWSARLTQPLLLALRLGILASVVLALAGPRVEAGRRMGPARLVLVEPALLDDSTIIRSDPLLDSLARSRSTVRLLAPGLPKVQLDGVQTAFRVPGSAFRVEPHGARHAEPGTLWDLLATAEQDFAPRELVVIARPRMTRLGGRRPALAAKVIWHAPVPPGPVSWTAARWRPSPPPLRVAIRGGDSLVSRRLGVAARAVATELGQALTLGSTIDSADLLIEVGGLSDSLLRLRRHLITIVPAVALSPGAADSLWARWPWPPLARDTADPRTVSLAQAQPGWTRRPARAEHDLRVPLLLLAAVLLLTERWLSNRPARRLG